MMNYSEKIPTDYQLLKYMYDEYCETFESFKKSENTDRKYKLLIPIDTKKIADHFGVDKEIIFTRLYIHLNRKYGFEESNGSKVLVFIRDSSAGRNVINFPFMSSILAELQLEEKRHKNPLIISIIALIISAVGFIWNLYSIFKPV